MDDGNDAPIEIARVETPVALPSLLLAAPPGAYTLLAGNPDAERPQYEIERARDVVLDLRTVAATSGPGGENTRWTGTPGGTASRQRRLQQLAIWGAIVLAVVVLGALTLRMARRTG